MELDKHIKVSLSLLYKFLKDVLVSSEEFLKFYGENKIKIKNFSEENIDESLEESKRISLNFVFDFLEYMAILPKDFLNFLKDEDFDDDDDSEVKEDKNEAPQKIFLYKIVKRGTSFAEVA